MDFKRFDKELCACECCTNVKQSYRKQFAALVKYDKIFVTAEILLKCYHIYNNNDSNAFWNVFLVFYFGWKTKVPRSRHCLPIYLVKVLSNLHL